jgi:hypothetical protein
MDWAQVFQSKFTWLALGAGVAAVGYTVYRGIRGGTDGSGGAGGLSDGEMPASHSGNVVATPEIRRSSTSDRSATAGRNSRNTTPVLASARTGGSAPDGIPVMSLEHEVPSDTEGDAVVIPRVVEEHEHHAEIVMQPPEGELTSRQVRNGDLCLTTLGLPNGSMAVLLGTTGLLARCRNLRTLLHVFVSYILSVSTDGVGHACLHPDCVSDARFASVIRCILRILVTGVYCSWRTGCDDVPTNVWHVIQSRWRALGVGNGFAT